MDANTKDVLVVLLPAISTGIVGYFTYRVSLASAVAKARELVTPLLAKVEEVRVATNSHTDLLLTATKAAAHASGKDEARAEQAARDVAIRTMHTAEIAAITAEPERRAAIIQRIKDDLLQLDMPEPKGGPQ